MTKQYIVTYDSNNETYVVHRREAGLPNMDFQIHSLGIHVYHPNKQIKSNITFINTVPEKIK